MIGKRFSFYRLLIINYYFIYGSEFRKLIFFKLITKQTENINLRII